MRQLKSLEYSELLITHHPDKWQGYGRAAQDLVALKRFEKAQERIQAGLEELPNQLNLLTIATDVYRASGDREKSLEYSVKVVSSIPIKVSFFINAAKITLFTIRTEIIIVTADRKIISMFSHCCEMSKNQ